MLPPPRDELPPEERIAPPPEERIEDELLCTAEWLLRVAGALLRIVDELLLPRMVVELLLRDGVALERGAVREVLFTWLDGRVVVVLLRDGVVVVTDCERFAVLLVAELRVLAFSTRVVLLRFPAAVIRLLERTLLLPKVRSVLLVLRVDTRVVLLLTEFPLLFALLRIAFCLLRSISRALL